MMNKYIKKLFGFSLGPVIGAFLSFITIPLITYFISPDEYGRVSMFTLSQSVLGMLVYLGTDQSFIKFYNDEDSKSKLFFNSIFPALFTSLILMVLMWCFKRSLSDFLFGVPDEDLCVLSLIVYLPFCVLERFISVNTRMLEKSVKYSFFSVLIKALILVFSILFLSSYQRSFRSVIYATVIAQVSGSIIIGILSLKDLNIKEFSLDTSLIKRLIAFGLPLVPATIVGWLLNSIDKIMIRSDCGYEQLGLYSAALKIVSVLAIVQSCFASFWSPVAFKWNKENKPVKTFELVGDLLSFIMVLMLLGILLFKNIIIKILSPEYIDSVNILPFLLLYPIMYTISEVTVVGIYFTGKSYTTIIIAFCSCIVNFGLNYVLIPLYGASGAAIATGLSYVLFFWLRTLISRKIWKKFNIAKYAMYTCLLLIACLLNTTIHNNLIYVANIVFIVCVFVVNIPLIKKVLGFRRKESAI